ncbi:glycosyl transferase family protein [Methanocaldococcus villosus KIN24-T80]|uniref:Glycosyl transferase family protein n=1 Tax=Methanocaldococcus villosus KIN24-T80 TaxID=1069083 RepID=N6VP83_9EURY|nr:glycosyltransferase family 9 protein [Methanocaldococcus villosus]ENN95680.1 glycosyl transferase family protein [Methanocaldococcus villosus KIN24-T80]
MKILIIALSGIGNLIMAFPMINILKKNYPNSKIDFLVALRGTREVLENQPFVNKIFVLKNQSIRSLLLDNYTKAIIKLLKTNNYDIAITIYPSQGIFSALLMKLIKAKIRIQHKYNFKIFENIDWFLTYSPKIENKHSVYINLDLIKYLNVKYKDEDIRYSYYLTQKEIKFANKFLDKQNLKDEFIIGIHPGGKSDMVWKRWGIKKWKKLIDLLNSEYKNKIKFLIFLGPDEIIYEKYFRNHDNVIIIKNIPLKYVISLISKCNYFISNDSGLSHCASLFNIPQSVIFGGTSYIHTAPFSNKVNIITPPNYEIYYIPYYGFIKKPKNLLMNLEPEDAFESIKTHIKTLNLI